MNDVFRAIVVAGLSVPMVAALSACGAEADAKSELRAKIALCEKDRNDPNLDASARSMIVGPVCERFKEEFRTRFRAEP